MNVDRGNKKLNRYVYNVVRRSFLWNNWLRIKTITNQKFYFPTFSVDEMILDIFNLLFDIFNLINIFNLLFLSLTISLEQMIFDIFNMLFDAFNLINIFNLLFLSLTISLEQIYFKQYLIVLLTQ